MALSAAPTARLARGLARRVPGARALALRARFGDLRRTDPVGGWGYERGTPVDRWYIDRWLARWPGLVRGRALEVKGDDYASRLGAQTVEVVDIDPGNARADVVGDLCLPGTLEAGRYDAAVVTQTLQFVAHPDQAVANVLRALRPGATLLVTVPVVSRVGGEQDRWRWTPLGLHELLAAAAPPGALVETEGLGNDLACRAFLFGLAVEDLAADVLAHRDPRYPLVAGGRVRLPG